MRFSTMENENIRNIFIIIRNKTLRSPLKRKKDEDFSRGSLKYQINTRCSYDKEAEFRHSSDAQNSDFPFPTLDVTSFESKDLKFQATSRLPFHNDTSRRYTHYFEKRNIFVLNNLKNKPHNDGTRKYFRINDLSFLSQLRAFARLIT